MRRTTADRAGAPFWEPPRAQRDPWQADGGDERGIHADRPFDAPEDNVERAFEFLATMRRQVPIGTFVFVLSDFIAPVATAAWAEAIDEGWDVVPVVVQDPIWEQSFPRIDGVRVLLADALEEQARYVRLNEVDVAERRKHNEQRLAGLRTEFARLGLDTIVDRRRALRRGASGVARLVARAPRREGIAVRRPTTRGGVAAAAVVLVVLALLVGALIAAQRWWSGAGGSYAPPTPLARAVVDPPRSLFGQVLDGDGHA